MSELPASFSFTISPPVWRRWWFLTLAMMTIALAAFMTYRYRVSRLLELERIRTRIAADLHDDIGANLTRITILSEVVDQQLERGGKPERATVLSIAEISRESAASMRDIVWAINPKRDRLLDLSRRMRGFASDIFTSRNIQFQFHAPDRDRDLRLGPEVRRDVFLIFKEAVSNVVRHSSCTEAVIQLAVEGGELVLTVSDDGEGFVLGGDGEGHGLASMRRRAEGFGGKLEFGTSNGRGTRVTVRVPIGKRH
jgi:signal transduction histidine kinase